MLGPGTQRRRTWPPYVYIFSFPLFRLRPFVELESSWRWSLFLRRSGRSIFPKCLLHVVCSQTLFRPRLSLARFVSQLEQIGFTDATTAEQAFHFTDCDKTGVLTLADLVRFEGAALSDTLTDFAEFVTAVNTAFSGGDCHDTTSLRFDEVFIPARATTEAATRLSFAAFGRKLKKRAARAGSTMDATTLWNLMGCSTNACVQRDDLKTLGSLSVRAAQGAVGKLKILIGEKFGGQVSGLWEALFERADEGDGSFGDGSFFERAETKKPRIVFGKTDGEGAATSSVYKGREWLQRFYNSLGDIERGRAVSSR